MCNNTSPAMWQNVFASTPERISYLLLSQQFSDIKFVIGSPPHCKIFSSHKLILAMSSEVFSAMFYGSLPEQGNEVYIPDIEPDAFQLFLGYIYTDEIYLQTTDSAIKVYWLAEKYMVSRLKIICCSYMSNNLSPDTACEIFELSKLGNCHSLRFQAWKYLVTNTEAVIKSLSFANGSFDTIFWIMSRRWLNVSSESILFEGVSSWAHSECFRKQLETSPENLRLILEPIIPLVRFLSMTSAEFVKHVIPTEILTKDETLCLLEYLVDPDSVELPQHFNKCKKLRNQPMLENGPESLCIITCEEVIAQICCCEARIFSKFKVSGHNIYIVGIELYLSNKKHNEVIKTKAFHSLFEIGIAALLTVINRSNGQIIASRLTKINCDQYGNSQIYFKEPLFVISGETCEIMLDIEGGDSSLYWCKGRHTSNKELEDDVIFTFEENLHVESNRIPSHVHKILFWTVD